ncbi:MAG TPA: hypothetical protein DCL49_12960 [Candidatus Omnitrophica bacterium]|nr:hypothetical protein [Candidatus Omnitrophota bacterium]
MNPYRLICFRLFNITLGRFFIVSRTLRKALVWLLITKKKQNERYGQCSRYFDIRELYRHK